VRGVFLIIMLRGRLASRGSSFFLVILYVNVIAMFLLCWLIYHTICSKRYGWHNCTGTYLVDYSRLNSNMNRLQKKKPTTW
jgi:hypothetical protein